MIDKEDKKSIKLDMMAVSSDLSDSPRRKRLGWMVSGFREKGERRTVLKDGAGLIMLMITNKSHSAAAVAE